jgi:hypothetical protein
MTVSFASRVSVIMMTTAIVLMIWLPTISTQA